MNVLCNRTIIVVDLDTDDLTRTWFLVSFMIYIHHYNTLLSIIRFKTLSESNLTSPRDTRFTTISNCLEEKKIQKLRMLNPTRDCLGCFQRPAG